MGRLERNPIRSLDTKLMIYYARYNAFTVTSADFIAGSSLLARDTARKKSVHRRLVANFDTTWQN